MCHWAIDRRPGVFPRNCSGVRSVAREEVALAGDRPLSVEAYHLGFLLRYHPHLSKIMLECGMSLGLALVGTSVATARPGPSHFSRTPPREVAMSRIDEQLRATGRAASHRDSESTARWSHAWRSWAEVPSTRLPRRPTSGHRGRDVQGAGKVFHHQPAGSRAPGIHPGHAGCVQGGVPERAGPLSGEASRRPSQPGVERSTRTSG